MSDRVEVEHTETEFEFRGDDNGFSLCLSDSKDGSTLCSISLNELQHVLGINLHALLYDFYVERLNAPDVEDGQVCEEPVNVVLERMARVISRVVDEFDGFKVDIKLTAPNGLAMRLSNDGTDAVPNRSEQVIM